MPQKLGFWGVMTPWLKCDMNRTPRSTSMHRKMSQKQNDSIGHPLILPYQPQYWINVGATDAAALVPFKI